LNIKTIRYLSREIMQKPLTSPSTIDQVLNAVLQHTPDLFAAIDTNYRLLAVNQPFVDAFQQVYGQVPEVGASLIKLLEHVPYEQQQVLKLWGRGLSGEEFTITQQFGELERRSYEIRFYPIRNEQHQLIGTFQLVQDVTAQRQLRHQLAQEEATLQSFFDSAPLMMGIVELVDEDILHLAANAKAKAFFGEHCQHCRFSELGISPEMIAEWRQHYLVALNTHQAVRFEYTTPQAQGLSFHSATVSVIGTGPSGNPRFSYTVDDITDEKKVSRELQVAHAELELRVQEGTAQLQASQEQLSTALKSSEKASEQLRLFAEAMPQMAFIADEQGNITYFNQRHYDYFSIGQGVSEDWKWAEANMLHPDDLAATVTRWKQSIQRGDPYEMEYRLRRHDGCFRWHLARALPVKNAEGQIVKWVGTNTDIDEQKKAAVQLDQLLKAVEFEKSRFEAIVQQMPAAVIIGEAPSGKLIFANDKMAEVWGHELIPSQDISDYVKWIGFHPDGRRYEPHEWPLARSIAQGEVVNNEDVEILRGDGERGILRLSSTPLYNNAGEIVAGVVICQEVTELKNAIRGRDEFLSICSHELKTPLTSLKLASQSVQRNLQKGDPQALSPERMLKLISQTETQVNRLARLVDDMLDISRISSGRLSLQVQPFDLCQLLHEVGERTQALFEGAGSSLSVSTCTPLICQGDAYRIEQVLINLLTNAARYGQDSPVSLSVIKQGNHAQVRVTDQGRGIAPADHQRIFNRYERGVSASEVSGLGLGLFISQQIVEMHQGKIWLESQLGQGASFYVELPLINPTAP
jgi:PAS domain S-box-containing protein